MRTPIRPCSSPPILGTVAPWPSRRCGGHPGRGRAQGRRGFTASRCSQAYAPARSTAGSVWLLTVMNPGGTSNEAFQVNTLAVDQETGEPVQNRNRHRSPGAATTGAAPRPWTTRPGPAARHERLAAMALTPPAATLRGRLAFASLGREAQHRVFPRPKLLRTPARPPITPAWLRSWHCFGRMPIGAELSGHGGPDHGVAHSPDGRQVISAGFDYAVILWDLESQTQLRGFYEHEGAGQRGDLPAARRASRSRPATTAGRLWDVGSGDLLHTFEGHQGKVAAVAVSPDGGLAPGFSRRLQRCGSGTSTPGARRRSSTATKTTSTPSPSTPDGSQA